jgi:hypothetical protein
VLSGICDNGCPSALSSKTLLFKIKIPCIILVFKYLCGELTE